TDRRAVWATELGRVPLHLQRPEWPGSPTEQIGLQRAAKVRGGGLQVAPVDPTANILVAELVPAPGADSESCAGPVNAAAVRRDLAQNFLLTDRGLIIDALANVEHVRALYTSHSEFEFASVRLIGQRHQHGEAE